MSDRPSPLKSPVPLICQSGPGLNAPAAAPEMKFRPFISQIAGVPSLFCHRMSDLPSALKSPVALICQLGPGLNGPTAPTDTAVVPFISQIAGVPSLPCQTMSDRPSPLKSPVVLICQLGPGLNAPATPTDTALAPFISQIAGVPSSPCQRMSDRPSPLKSPPCLTCQFGPGSNVPATPTDTAVLPFIIQSAGVPSLPCHRMSLRPLALKSLRVSMVKIDVFTSSSAPDGRPSTAKAMRPSERVVASAPNDALKSGWSDTKNSEPIWWPTASNRCAWMNWALSCQLTRKPPSASAVTSALSCTLLVVVLTRTFLKPTSTVPSFE